MARAVQWLLKHLPVTISDQLRALRHRAYWLYGRGTQFHNIHENGPQDLVLEGVDQLLKLSPTPTLRVIEFGCSAGNNLWGLRHSCKIPIKYFGVDIQPSAISLASEKYPTDRFLHGDASALTAMIGKEEVFDVFVASAVLYYLPEKEVVKVLGAAAQLAKFVLVCDYLEAFHEESGRSSGLFFHPFAKLCHQAGLEIIQGPPECRASNGPRLRPHGAFLARSAALGSGDAC